MKIKSLIGWASSLAILIAVYSAVGRTRVDTGVPTAVGACELDRYEGRSVTTRMRVLAPPTASSGQYTATLTNDLCEVVVRGNMMEVGAARHYNTVNVTGKVRNGEFDNAIVSPYVESISELRCEVRVVTQGLDRIVWCGDNWYKLANELTANVVPGTTQYVRIVNDRVVYIK